MTTTTLTDDDLPRIKHELGDNYLSLNALPIIGIRNVWAVIRDSVVSSTTPATSSSTAVAAAGAVTLTVASVAGLSANARVQLDVDGSRETVTIRSVSGFTISVICRKAHSGTYPVEIESALTITRGCIADLIGLEQVTNLASFDSLGLIQVDEVQWSDRGQQHWVTMARNSLRAKLASSIGVADIYARYSSSGSNGMEVY